MTPDSLPGLTFRTEKLEEQVREMVHELVETSKMTAVHQERISGENGLVRHLNEVKDEIRSLKRSNYTLLGGLVLAAIGYYVLSGGAPS